MIVRMNIEKYFASASEYWSNVYYCVADSPTAAISIADAVVNAEKATIDNAIIVTKAHLDDMTPGTEVFATKVYNAAGTKTVGTGDRLPLFVVCRVDFSTLGGGRPSRKYLRAILTEGDTTFTSIGAANLTLLATYAAAIVTAGCTDVDGQVFTSGSVLTPPAMRQLRRGSKKTSTP